MTASLRAAGLLAATTTTLALGACGGGGDETLSKSELAAKANAICKTYNAKVNAVPHPKSLSDAGQAATYYAAVTKLAVEQQGKLKALKPADDVKADWNAYIDLADQGDETIKAITAAARAQDAAKGGTLIAKINALAPKINAAADKVGATTCGSDSSKS